MSQHDYVIGNDTAANVRADINTALLAIASNNSGASAPATTYANQWWYDSTNDILKIRSETNDAWISVAKLNQTSDQFFPIVGGVEVTATGTELNFVDGVTSAIQTQLNAKAPLTGTGTSGTWPISISGDAATVDGKSIGTLTAAGGIAYATSTTALAAIGAGTAGQALVSGGAGAPTWSTIATGGMTLLGTITTTSGSTQTLSGLTLTGYIGLIAVFNGVGHATTNSNYTFANCGINSSVIAGGGQYRGIVKIDLATGSGVSMLGSITAAAPASTAVSQQVILRTNITTASTSISVTTSASAFNTGSIRIYGVK